MNKCITWVIRYVEVNYLRFVYEPFELTTLFEDTETRNISDSN